MTPKQFSKAITLLGFNQSSFARTIDVSDRMVRNWVAGTHKVPTPIAMLLNLMLDTKTSKEDLKG